MHDQVLGLRQNQLRGYTDDEHIAAAAQWLAHAQDVTSDGGVSGRYLLNGGWTSSYPETTGYIVPTFLALARTLDPTFRARAERCVRFLLNLQLADGAFPGGEVAENRTRPSVFNTAQIINGLVAWHRETGDTAAAQAAARAADWMVAQQDDDGAWRKHIYGNVTTYTAHASCWLAEAGRHFGNEKWLRAAERHLDWVLTNVDADTGWIALAGFGNRDHEQHRAVTHTLAYTIWGVLYLSQLLGRDDGLAVARRAAERVMRRLELSGWLPGEIDHRWKAARSDYACLTGNAQMALIWFRLAELTGDMRFCNAALKAIDLVSAAQPMDNSDPGIRGGIPGSAPIWGGYITMGVPNWAAKFYVDALLAKRAALASMSARAPTSSDDRSTAPSRVDPSVESPIVTNAQSGDAPLRVVFLTSPDSHKVPQMVRAWQSWGFKPAAVVVEHRPVATVASRLTTRAREDGIARMLAGATMRRIRRRPATVPTAVAPASPDVHSLCAEAGIPVVHVGLLSDHASVVAVARTAPDVLVHAGAGILRKPLLATARLGALNAHMGILPRYRGMNVTEWARFERGAVGCTVHLVDEGIDTGDVLATCTVDPDQAESVEHLRALVDEAQIGLLGRVLRFVVETGTLPSRKPQAGDQGRQYFRMHPRLKAVLERELAAAYRTT